jgi:endo-1,4-beta-mannosidase
MASARLVWALVAAVGAAGAAARWTEERAQAWWTDVGWLAGANFAPRVAVNQIDMWRAPTFNASVMAEELSWAQSLGFNSMRVFLHDSLWREDAAGLLTRMDTYLALADARGIGTMFVLFDGVWDPYPVDGPQLAPVPFVHNSRWVQGPGRNILGDPARHGELRDYVVGVVSRFAADKRVQVWDLFNEPDNPVRGPVPSHVPPPPVGRG